MTTDGAYDATGHQTSVSASVVIKSKENSRYYLYILPSIGYPSETVNSSNSSVTRSEGSQLNTSVAAATASAKGINTNGGLNFGLKEMGKKGRSLTSHETTVVKSTGQTTAKDLPPFWLMLRRWDFQIYV